MPFSKLIMILTNATRSLVFVVALFVVSRSGTSCTDQERQTLLSFLATLSTPLQSWNATIESDCCKWEGIACNPSNSVTEISLPSKDLAGQISSVLSNLTNLSYLDLSHNFLYGSLPVELLFLSASLKVIDVSFNKLSGVMPGFENPMIQVLDVSSNLLTGLIPIINATTLLSLNATNNSLTGPIPGYLCTNSPFLISLAISYNELTGNIPPILGNCTNLRDFIAESNNLVGSLPDELSKLVSLQNLYLSDNRISGSLNGTIIAQLQNLVNLDLSTNFITGSIPDAIGQLTKLQYVNLGNNYLTGLLPSAIENCSDLRQLNLQRNNLTGNLQLINFTKLSNLELLDLLNNSFTGQIPESLYTCNKLNALRLSQNDISGQISPNIESLRALSFLSLVANNLTNITGALENLSKCKNLTVLLIGESFFGEVIPTDPLWENGFENIQLLSMEYCNFTGTIPTWISKLTKLEFLDISRNHFSGHIPDWLGNLSDLFFLNLSHNYLSGDIPQSITRLPSLNSVRKLKQLNPGDLRLPIFLTTEPYHCYIRQYKQLTAMPPTVNLSNNQLNGTVPQEIGQLKMLLKLDLSKNNLSGPIPKSIGNLTSLEFLDLSGNELTGQIPASLTHLNFLSTFSVAYNNLSGPVPYGGQLTTFSSSSYEGNNLCGPVVMRNCSNPSHGDNKTPLISESFDRNTVIAIALGYFFGVVATVLVQFYRDFLRAWLRNRLFY